MPFVPTTHFLTLTIVTSFQVEVSRNFTIFCPDTRGLEPGLASKFYQGLVRPVKTILVKLEFNQSSKIHEIMISII